MSGPPRAREKVVWNVTPIGGEGGAGLGGGTENDPADAAAGHGSPLPSKAPAAAASPREKARRESPSRAWCEDSEPGAPGHPLRSMPSAFMVTAPGRGGPEGETLTPHH
jgi:hypothetical protein